MSTIAVQFPLVINDSSSTIGFETLDVTNIADLKQLFRFHIKNILLTHPGERIWDSSFGVGLQQFLFDLEQTTDLEALKSRILNQLELYADYINITSLKVSLIPNELAINIQLQYFVDLQGQLNSVQDVFDFTITEFETYDGSGALLSPPP